MNDLEEIIIDGYRGLELLKNNNFWSQGPLPEVVPPIIVHTQN